MWKVSCNYTSESTSSNILHQSWCRMVCQVIPWLEVLLSTPCYFLVPSRLLHRCYCTSWLVLINKKNTDILSAYVLTPFKLFMNIKELFWGFVNRNNSCLFSSVNLNQVEGSIKGVDFSPVALEVKAEQSIKIFLFLCCHSLLSHLPEVNFPSISNLRLSNPQWSHTYWWLLHKRCSDITGK